MRRRTQKLIRIFRRTNDLHGWIRHKDWNGARVRTLQNPRRTSQRERLKLLRLKTDRRRLVDYILNLDTSDI